MLLLALRRKDFPVDVNVARICARLGWIPLDSEEAIEVPGVEDMMDYQLEYWASACAVRRTCMPADGFADVCASACYAHDCLACAHLFPVVR